MNGCDYERVHLNVLPHLCFFVILSHDFQRLHDSVMLTYGGNLHPLVICGLSTLSVDPPELFANLTVDCHLVAAKSQRHSPEDCEFIE